MPELTANTLADSTSTDSRTPRTKAWGLTLVLGLLYLITYTDKILLGLVAQPLKDEFGLTASDIGLAGSIFFLAYIIGGLGAGQLNKWFTLRWSLVVLSIAWALCMLPMVFAASFTVLMISRFILGLAEGPSASLVYTAIYSWHPVEKRSLPGAFVPASSSIAKLLAAPALALVIATWGWRAAFVTMVIVGFVWCALWITTWSEGPYGERPTAAPKPEAGTTSTQEPAKVPWMAIFRTPTFVGGVAAMIAMNALLAVTLTWLPSYFEEGLGYSRLQAGSLFAIPSIAALTALFVVTPISDRLTGRGASTRVLRGVVPGVSLLLCGLTLVVIPYLSVPAVVVAVISIGYGFGTVVYPQISAAISQICPKNQLAGTLGVFFALMSLGGVFGPYVTGLMVDAAASPADGFGHAFQLFGIVAVIGAVITLIAVNPARDARRLMPTHNAA
ncbi:MFS transporter [Rhodococcus sp. G-MC3]|uniref:MFS transporter n=1 Tax=Rhodococcus sp. G-MC3 TaxID=3046209 RepID=UPI0024B93B4D|nr:MFS transporter [Rhodococcus sp. G-MC3]MDJ0396572.1 MFS transporter [Rhodococcus sp. G-MC3]